MSEDSRPASIIAYILSINTWSKAGIAICIGTVAVWLHIAYQEPQQVFDFLRDWRYHPEQAQVAYLSPLVLEVDRELAALLAQFPDLFLVTAWRADMQTNRAQLQAWQVLPMYQPMFDVVYAKRWRFPMILFGEQPHINHALGQMFIGRFYCTTEFKPWRFTVITNELPIKELCMVPIPPDGYGLGGFIAGMWSRQLDATELADVESAFRDVARRLTYVPRSHKNP